MSHWLDEIIKFDVQGQIYLVGCKSDLDIEVPTDEILIFAEAYGVKYLQTSAKESIGVEDAFQQVIEEAAQAKLISMAFEKPDAKVAPDVLVERKEVMAGLRSKCC